MSSGGARIGLLGATGALGSEVLAALDASRLRIAQIVPVAGEGSAGEALEFQDAVITVLGEAPSPRGLDLVFCCAPPAAALAWVREALRAGVPVIDCSGALRETEEVPLRVAWLPAPAGAEGAPAIATPSGAALAASLVLAPLQAAAPLRRVVATVLESAAAGGRRGIAALSAESLALFNQQESQEPAGFGRPLAFDCHPSLEPPDAGGDAPRERDLARSLARLLGADLAVAATVLQMPTFVGLALSLALELGAPLDPKEAEERLAHAAGVELWSEPLPGPNLRAASGRDVVIAGRVRPDPTVAHGLQLWVVADALRLAAANAVALAVARLQSH